MGGVNQKQLLRLRDSLPATLNQPPIFLLWYIYIVTYTHVADRSVCGHAGSKRSQVITSFVAIISWAINEELQTKHNFLQLNSFDPGHKCFYKCEKWLALKYVVSSEQKFFLSYHVVQFSIADNPASKQRPGNEDTWETASGSTSFRIPNVTWL